MSRLPRMSRLPHLSPLSHLSRLSHRRCPGLGLFLLLLNMILPPGARAEAFRLLESSESAIVVECTLPPMTMETVSAGGSVYTKVEVADSGTGGNEGAPRLPVLRRLLEVPVGAAWSVSVESPEFREIPLTSPVLPLQPVQYRTAPEPPFVLDAAAYSQTGFPETPLAELQELGTMRQHRLALLRVDAVQYDPARRVLRVLDRARVRIEFRPTTAPMLAAERERLRSPIFDEITHRLVLNATPLRYEPGPPVGLLVVSAAEFADDPILAAFLAAKARRGLHVTHVSTAEIGGSATEIRDYIRDAFWNWAIPPTCVLLVGDTPQIPHWIGTGYRLPPTDLYYAALWQEEPFTDYIPDLDVGRLSVADLTQLHNLLGKIRSYEEIGWTGNDTWEKYAAFMAGADHAGDNEGQLNAIIDAFLNPLGYTVNRLYCATHHAQSYQVTDAFNAGRALGAYSGHGSTTMWLDGPVFRQVDVANLTNEVYPLIQSYSCQTGRFSEPECFGETWIRVAHGAVGFFGSSEDSPTLWDGVLSWHFNEGIYNAQAGGYAVNRTWMGGAATYAKLSCAEHLGDDSYTRGYLEQYNFLGDPSVDIWTDVPAVIPVEAPELLVEGPTGLEINVVGQPNLMVTAQKHDGLDDFFVATWTDSSGHAGLSFPGPIGTGMLGLSVTGHDRVPWYREVPVIPPEGPTLIADSLHVLDPAGDADGQGDAGERLGLTLDLKNIGFGVAAGTWGFLQQTVPPGLEIVAGERSYGNIAPGDTRTNDQPFEVRLLSNLTDQQELLLNLSAESDDLGLWSCHYRLAVQAPVLRLCGDLVDDSPPRGDGDGVAEPGETIYLSFWVENTGHADAGNLAGGLACPDAYVEILDADGQCFGVGMEQRALLGVYKVKILDACPNPSMLALHAVMSTPDGELTTLSYDLAVGAWFDDVETDRGWQMSAPEDDATDGFWERVHPIRTNAQVWHGPLVQPDDDHTPGGWFSGRCFITENPIGVGYPPGDADVDGGSNTLLSPIFDLGNATSAIVGYWRWYTNHLGPNPGEDWWDVDVTADGENWVHLEHTTESANEWTFFSFDVGAYVPLTDKIQFRFVASDDPPDALVEAAVDDISLAVSRPLPTGVPDEGIVSRAGFVGVYPNPLGPRGRIILRQNTRAHLRISLFDVAGRLVRRLVDAEADPGLHTLQFDGENGAGRSLPSGVYFLKLETPGVKQYRQVTILQ